MMVKLSVYKKICDFCGIVRVRNDGKNDSLVCKANYTLTMFRISVVFCECFCEIPDETLTIHLLFFIQISFFINAVKK